MNPTIATLIAPAYSVPQPTPQAPTAGVATIMGDLIGYALWGAFGVCALCAVIAGAYIAIGHMSGRPVHREKGLLALFAALGGAAVTGLAIPLTNSFISIAGG